MADQDIRHAVRNATRHVVMDDDLTMLIGTAMPHTDDQISRAAARFECLADKFDPAEAGVDDTTDLQAIAVAAETARSDEARLREAVEVARARGRSWNHIALALGVSRQAARQRFSNSEPRPGP